MGKMLKLGFIFLLLEIVTMGSTRCIIDIGVFVLLYLLKSTCIESKHVIRNLLIMISAIIAVVIAISRIPRIAHLAQGGFNADASGASRWFRVNASILGFRKQLVSVFAGFGMGNLVIPLKLGYQDALSSFKNAFASEVVKLGNASAIDSLYCLPIKIASDFGVLLLCAFLLYIFLQARRKHIDLFVVIMTLWLYVQFDSYAFYSLWILIYILRFYDYRCFGRSYFSEMSKTLNKVVLTK